MVHTVWARMISHRYPSLTLTAHVGDRTIRRPERQCLLDALCETARIDNEASHELNWTKTELTADNPSDRNWLKSVDIDGRSCPSLAAPRLSEYSYPRKAETLRCSERNVVLKP